MKPAPPQGLSLTINSTLFNKADNADKELSVTSKADLIKYGDHSDGNIYAIDSDSTYDSLPTSPSGPPGEDESRPVASEEGSFPDSEGDVHAEAAKNLSLNDHVPPNADPRSTEVVGSSTVNDPEVLEPQPQRLNVSSRRPRSRSHGSKTSKSTSSAESNRESPDNSRNSSENNRNVSVTSPPRGPTASLPEAQDQKRQRNTRGTARDREAAAHAHLQQYLADLEVRITQLEKENQVLRTWLGPTTVDPDE